MMSIPDQIKHWWPTVTACLFVITAIGTSINYYARAEAEELINIKMAKPLEKLNQSYGLIQEKTNKIEKKVDELEAEQKRSNEVTREKLNGLDGKIDTILRLLEKK